MKVAHIIPPIWCSGYKLGDYRFGLAQWVKSREVTYTKPMKNDKAYVILDNGAFEGQKVSDTKLLEYAQQIGADEVVLPDVVGDAKATLNASYKAFQKFSKFRTMFVPHGQSLAEWIECVDAWVSKIRTDENREEFQQLGYHTIGISPLRYLEGGYKHTKEMITHVIELGMPIHLLGIANMKYFTSELLPNLVEWNIRGVDTSYAFALAANNQWLQPDSPKILLGDPEQYNILNYNQRRLVALNMNILNDWIAKGEVDRRGLSDMVIRNTASQWVKFYQRHFERLEMVMRICGMSGQFIIRDDFVKAYKSGDPFNKDWDWIIQIK